MLTFIPEINSMLLLLIKVDKDERENISFNPVDVNSLFARYFLFQFET